MFCTRLANGGLFPNGDPIVPFVISPRFECLNKLTTPAPGIFDKYLIVTVILPWHRVVAEACHDLACLVVNPPDCLHTS